VTHVVEALGWALGTGRADRRARAS
jgi:hypothetical protein